MKGRFAGFRLFAMGVAAALAFVWISRQEGACRPFDKTPASTVAPEPQAINLQESFAKVASVAKPAVVSITTVHVESVQAMPYQFYFGDPFQDFFNEFYGAPQQPRRRQAPPPQRRETMGMGSGVIIDPKGYILTNEHVVRDADEITVTLMDPEEKKYKGKVIGKDMRTDLAVVKIEPKEKLSFLSLADSDKVRVGDWSIAVGSPFGLEQTVTVGIISAVRQSLNIDGNSYANLLQTDAAINRGNSGGPLINIKGEIIGINTAIYAPTGVFAGIGFAIPSNRAKEIMEQLIAKGRVVRGWMGVEIAPLNEVLVRQFGLPDKDGVLINSVSPGSPADKAGLLRGDVIREFDGQKINDAEALMQVVGKTPPKKKVTVRIFRNGETKDLTLVTGEAPAEPEAESAAPQSPAPDDARSEVWEGAHLVTATPALAQRFGVAGRTDGVLVVRLDPGGTAAEMGLVEGDVVLSVNRQPTPNVKTFLTAARKADMDDGVLFDINRQGRLIYLSYKKGQ